VVELVILIFHNERENAKSSAVVTKSSNSPVSSFPTIFENPDSLSSRTSRNGTASASKYIPPCLNSCCVRTKSETCSILLISRQLSVYFGGLIQ